MAWGERCKNAKLVARVFRDNFHQCDCPEKLWVQDVEIAWGELRRATLKCRAFWHRVFRTNSINAIVPKKCARKTCEIDAKCWAMGHAWEKVRGWGFFFSARGGRRCTQECLHTDAFTHRSLHALKLLRRVAFKRRSLYTEKS